MSRRIRVMLVDDQPLFRRGIRMLVGSQDDLEVVGEAADGLDAVEVATEVQPDVVLMDIRMPRADGIEGTRGILQAAAAAAAVAAETSDRTEDDVPQSRSTPRIIVLTTFDLDDAALRAIRAGASGFLLKDAEPEFLLAAIRAVHGGHAVVAPGAIGDFLAHVDAHPDQRRGADDAERAAALAELSPREREIFSAIADGLSNAEIAEREFVSEATVKSHVGRILTKLGLRDRVQVVLYAHDHGLLPRR